MSSDRATIFYSVSVFPVGRSTGTPSDVTDRVTSFTYEDKEFGTDVLRLSVDNFDLQQFEDPIFVTGEIIQITWGMGATVAQTRKMLIKKVTGGMTLTVEAHNEGAVMDAVRKRRKFQNVTRADVVRKIAAEYRFRNPDVEDTEEVFDEISQGNLSDAQFLRKLAYAQGYQFYLDANGLHWHERRLDQAPRKEYIWYNDPTEGEILSFNIENDITRRPGRVLVSSRDPLDKSELQASASNTEDSDRLILAGYTGTQGSYQYTTDGGQTWYPYDPDLDASLDPTVQAELNDTVQDRIAKQYGDATVPEFIPNGVSYELIYASNVQTPEEADREAKKTYRQRSQGAVKLTLTLRGDPEFEAKTIIKVSGLGKRVSGKYYVRSVTHTLSATGGYVMSVKTITDGYQAKPKGTIANIDADSSLDQIADALAGLSIDEISTKVGSEGEFAAADSVLIQLFRDRDRIVAALRGLQKKQGEDRIAGIKVVMPIVARFAQDAANAKANRTAESARKVYSVLQRIAAADGDLEPRAEGRLNTKEVSDTNSRESFPVPFVDAEGQSQTRYENNKASQERAARDRRSTVFTNDSSTDSDFILIDNPPLPEDTDFGG